MTDEELKKRADLYRQLVEFVPFLTLVEELEEMVEQTKEAVVNDLVNDRILDKGIVTGIRIAINLPFEVVEQSEGNSEPS